MRGKLSIYAGLLAVVAVAAVWLGFGLVPDERDVTVVRGFEIVDRPEPAPDISFSDAAGNSLTLADFRGQVVLLNLWATWCAPCVEEMPSLDRLQAGLGGESFQVVALSVDRDGAAKILPFYEAHGIEHLGVYADTAGRSLQALGVLGLPTSYLIDREGRLVASYAGAKDWDSDASIAELRRYVGDNP